MRTPMGKKYFARTCAHIEQDKEDTFPDSRCLILVRSYMIVFSVDIGLQEVNTFKCSSVSKHLGEKRLYVFSVLTGMVITCDFPCTYILVLVKNLCMFYSFQTERNGTWIHGRLDSWQNGSTAAWIHGTMDAWQFGFMALWMNSSLDAWPNGCIAVWIHANMEVWQFGCMVFSKTSPHAICGCPKSKHIMYARPYLQ